MCAIPAGQPKRRAENSRAHQAMYEDAMKQLRRKKTEGGKLDAQEEIALDADQRQRRARKKKTRDANSKLFKEAAQSIDRKYVRGEELDTEDENYLFAEQRRKIAINKAKRKKEQKQEEFREAIRPKTMEEFIDASKKRLDKISPEERQQIRKDAAVNKRIKGGKTNLPSRKKIRDAFPEIVERSKKESGEPMSRSERLQQDVAEILAELDRRIAAELNRAQRDGVQLTPDLNLRVKQKVSTETLAALKAVDTNISAELAQFEDEDEISNAERELETLAERLYKEIDTVERIAAGEDLETPDPTEFGRGITLISALDEDRGLPPVAGLEESVGRDNAQKIEPVIPPAFLEEDPAFLAAERRNEALRNIRPEIPPAFLEEDPAILEAQRKEAARLEQEITERIENTALETQTDIEVAAIDVTAEGLGLEVDPDTIESMLPQETMQQYGFSWMFENPVQFNIEKQKLNTELQPYMIQNKEQLKKNQEELKRLYQIEGDRHLEELKESVVPGERALHYINTLDSRLTLSQVNLNRVTEEAKRMFAFNNEYKKSGLRLTAPMQAEFSAAVELVYEKRVQYNQAAAEYNRAFATFVYGVDQGRGRKMFIEQNRDALEKSSMVYNEAKNLHDRLSPLKEQGSAAGNRGLIERARLYFNYAEKRISDLVDVQRNSLLGERSQTFSHLAKLGVDIASMKSELALFELDNSVYQQLQSRDVGEVFRQTLGEYASTEEVDQISRAIAVEMRDRIQNYTTREQIIDAQKELAERYREQKENIDRLKGMAKNAETQLGKAGYDYNTTKGDWANRNIFNTYNKWVVRKSTNTGDGLPLDQRMALRAINAESSSLLSDEVLEQVESGNLTQSGVTELFALRDNMERYIKVLEGDLSETIAEGFALGEQFELVERNIQAGI